LTPATQPLAWLEPPPLADAPRPVARLEAPPPIAEREALAWFCSPPLTDAAWPLAALRRPPRIDSSPVKGQVGVGCDRVPVIPPQPPTMLENESFATLESPPVAAEPVFVAWLPTPPVTEAKLLACPVVSVQVLLRETVPAPARFEQPPVTLE